MLTASFNRVLAFGHSRTRPHSRSGTVYPNVRQKLTMPIPFQLTQRVVGFAASTASGGEPVQVIYRELIAPSEPAH
jgi:hypothetical protein